MEAILRKKRHRLSQYSEKRMLIRKGSSADGEKLLAFRRRLGMSIKESCEFLGITSGRASYILHGSGRMSERVKGIVEEELKKLEIEIKEKNVRF